MLPLEGDYSWFCYLPYILIDFHCTLGQVKGKQSCNLIRKEKGEGKKVWKMLISFLWWKHFTHTIALICCLFGISWLFKISKVHFGPLGHRSSVSNWTDGPRHKGFSSGSALKNTPGKAGDAGDAGSIPGSGRSPGGGHGNLLQYSCLENPMNRGAWWAAVHRAANRLKNEHVCRQPDSNSFLSCV